MFAEHGTVNSCIIMRDDEGEAAAGAGVGVVCVRGRPVMMHVVCMSWKVSRQLLLSTMRSTLLPLLKTPTPVQASPRALALSTLRRPSRRRPL